MARNIDHEEMLTHQAERIAREQDTRRAFWGADMHTVTVVWRQQLAQSGGDLRGLSMRQKQGEWLLVARITLNDIPQVAFISGADPIDCMAKLAKKIVAGTVAFCVDRYAEVA